MSDLTLVLKNTLALNIASVITNVLSFVTTLIIARHFGEAVFGQFTFALYFAGLFLVLIELGVDHILIREITRDHAASSRYLTQALWLRATMACVAIALMAGIAWRLPTITPFLRHAVVLAGCYVALQSLGTISIACYRGYERMEWAACLAVCLKALILVGVAITVAVGGGLRSLLASYGIAALCTVGLGGMLLTLHGIRWVAPWDWATGRHLLRESWPIAISMVCSSISGQLDVVVLRHFHTDASVGYYGAALTFVTALLFVAGNFVNALYPRFAQLAITSRAQLAQYYERSLVYLAVLCLPLATILTSWAQPIILRFYGAAYQPAVPLLQILGWALALQSMHAIFNILMFALNQQRLALAFHLAGTALTVVLDLVCIPRWGSLGAAAVRVVTFLFLFVVFYAVTARLLYRAPLLRTLAKPALAAGLIGLAAWGLRDLSWWMSIPLLGGSYVVILGGLRIFQWQGMLAGVQQWVGRRS